MDLEGFLVFVLKPYHMFQTWDRPQGAGALPPPMSINSCTDPTSSIQRKTFRVVSLKCWAMWLDQKLLATACPSLLRGAIWLETRRQQTARVAPSGPAQVPARRAAGQVVRPRLHFHNVSLLTD